MDTQSLRSLGLKVTAPCNAYELLTSGNTDGKVIRILRELVREYNTAEPIKKIKISGPQDAVTAAGNIFRGLDREECWALFLNNSLSVTGRKKISEGTLDSVVLNKRAIIVECLNRNACGIILMHNHPSGDPKPSSADVAMTADLKKSLESLDMKLFDHIVFGETNYYCFSDETINNFNS